MLKNPLLELGALCTALCTGHLDTPTTKFSYNKSNFLGNQS